MAGIHHTHTFMEKYIQEHKWSGFLNSLRDFIDVYLDEIRASVDKNYKFFGEVGGLFKQLSFFEKSQLLYNLL